MQEEQYHRDDGPNKMSFEKEPTNVLANNWQ